MATEIFNFDISEHLETDEDIREFLKETANTGDTSDLIHALRIASKAKETKIKDETPLMSL